MKENHYRNKAMNIIYSHALLLHLFRKCKKVNPQLPSKQWKKTCDTYTCGNRKRESLLVEEINLSKTRNILLHLKSWTTNIILYTGLIYYGWRFCTSSPLPVLPDCKFPAVIIYDAVLTYVTLLKILREKGHVSFW